MMKRMAHVRYGLWKDRPERMRFWYGPACCSEPQSSVPAASKLSASRQVGNMTVDWRINSRHMSVIRKPPSRCCSTLPGSPRQAQHSVWLSCWLSMKIRPECWACSARHPSPLMQPDDAKPMLRTPFSLHAGTPSVCCLSPTHAVC